MIYAFVCGVFIRTASVTEEVHLNCCRSDYAFSVPRYFMTSVINSCRPAPNCFYSQFLYPFISWLLPITAFIRIPAYDSV